MDSKYWDIAAKELQGRASPAEQEELWLWLAQDPLHREQYQAQQRLWELTPPAPDEEVDTDAAWQKVRTRVLMEKAGPKVISLYRTVWRVAASVVFLIGLAWLARYLFLPYYGMEVIRTGNSQVAFMLPDSSRVWLNRNSLLAYEPDFDGIERMVQLKGEAFFEVQRNPKRPFVVQTEKANTRVLGTSFNLRAYPSETTEELTVATGRVAFSASDAKSEVIVTPGSAAALSKESNTIRMYNTASANAWAWQSRRLQFEGTALAEVVQELERYYNVALQLQNKTLASCRFTGSFHGAELEEVLQVLEATLQLEYTKISEKSYTLSGQGCRR